MGKEIKSLGLNKTLVLAKKDIYKNNELIKAHKLYKKYFNQKIHIVRLEEQLRIYKNLIENNMIQEEKILLIYEFIEGIKKEMQETEANIRSIFDFTSN